jgi:hypothetical protein
MYPGGLVTDFSEAQWEVVCGAAYEVECSEITDYALNMLLGEGSTVAYPATLSEMAAMGQPMNAGALSMYNQSGSVDVIYVNVESYLYPGDAPKTWRHEFGHRVLGLDEADAESFAQSGACPN